MSDFFLANVLNCKIIQISYFKPYKYMSFFKTVKYKCYIWEKYRIMEEQTRFFSTSAFSIYTYL